MDYPDYSNFPSDYTSPFEPGTSPIGSDYDWGSFSKGIDWNQTPSVAGEGRWSEAFKKATDYLNSTKSRTLEEQKKRASSGIPGAQDLGGGISLAYPMVSQSAPQQSMFSRITGALAPAASLIPGAGPFISAGLGAASRLG
jgi:hypothetical protein